MNVPRMSIRLCTVAAVLWNCEQGHNPDRQVWQSQGENTLPIDLRPLGHNFAARRYLSIPNQIRHILEAINEWLSGLSVAADYTKRLHRADLHHFSLCHFQFMLLHHIHSLLKYCLEA